jgi:2-dehydro-3-deoxyphosphogluconate aldolase/(4S)-4-hydroxy-2-oxoglutarate aldolase
METLLKSVLQCGVVPVIKINDAGKAAPLAAAFKDGGVDVIEITFRTEAAEDAIREASFVNGVIVGAGTVVNTSQLERAVKAGAKFIVSPGYSGEVVKAALSMGVAILPGVITPTEIMAAMDAGLDAVKFFPADTFGGVLAIKALSAPFGRMQFVPTGGITQKNAPDYWKLPCVKAVGGSWLAPEKLINGGDFSEITRLSKQATDLCRSVKAETRVV